MWAAAGELALIQRVAERIEGFPGRNQPLATIRDVLGTFVKDTVQALLNVDFRTQFFAQNPQALLTLHPGDFIFAERRGDQNRIMHVWQTGTTEWVVQGRHAAIGSGDQFAYALLAKYTGIVLTCDRAKLLPFKVIEEAIQVGAYGLGPPIDIWHIDNNGVHRANDAERAALEDAAEGLRQQEVEMLVVAPAPAPVIAPEGPAAPAAN